MFPEVGCISFTSHTKAIPSWEGCFGMRWWYPMRCFPMLGGICNTNLVFIRLTILCVWERVETPLPWRCRESRQYYYNRLGMEKGNIICVFSLWPISLCFNTDPLRGWYAIFLHSSLASNDEVLALACHERTDTPPRVLDVERTILLEWICLLLRVVYIPTYDISLPRKGTEMLTAYCNRLATAKAHHTLAETR